MNIDDLKNQWNAEQPQKSSEEIQELTYTRLPKVHQSSRRKAIIESIGFLLAGLVFMTGLDPQRNANWVNIALIVVLLLGIGNNLLLYRFTTNSPNGQSMKQYLQATIQRYEKQIQISILYSSLFFGVVMAFLLLRTSLSSEKLGWVLLILPVSIGIRTWFEVRKWQQSIQHLRQMWEELTLKQI